MSDYEDGDYVFYGTPIEDEVESKRGQRNKPVNDPALTRSLPVWKQEVTDAEGRRRFHGAFTGGFSAGYFNTVGSKEGWTPSTFRSTRGERANVKQQNIEDFLDEDELEDSRRTALHTTSDYDTFGSTAADLARQRATEETLNRPSAIPGLPIDEIVVPVVHSVGMRLLQKMGWRAGKGVGLVSNKQLQESKGSSKWGLVSGVGVDNVPIHVLNPKQDLHGLGFDPFKGAEEFRQAAKRKAGTHGQDQSGVRAKRVKGVAFGAGVLDDEDDTYGLMEDYVTHGSKGGKEGLHFEIAGDEDEDEEEQLAGGVTGGVKGMHGGGSYRLPSAQPPPLQIKSQQHYKKPGSFIPGFIRASITITLPQFPAPHVPPEFTATHKAAASPSGDATTAAAPLHVPPPSDVNLRRTIETLAVFVAKGGSDIEAVARQKHAGQAGYAFLFGGTGAEYYAWRLHYLKDLMKVKVSKEIDERPAPLTAEERGNLLGEQQLPVTAPKATSDSDSQEVPQQKERQLLFKIAESDRARLQGLLNSNFVRSSAQEMDGTSLTQAGLREGGRRSKEEAPAVSGSDVPHSVGGAQELGGTGVGLSASGAGDKSNSSRPVRRIEDWRPQPLLCKRCNVPDPYKGRPMELQMSHFKTDYLSLPDTDAHLQGILSGSQAAAPGIHAAQRSSSPQHASVQQQVTSGSGREVTVPADSKTLADEFLDSIIVPGALPISAEAEGTDVEQFTSKPMDLFKAIFEASDDDSEDDDGQDGSEDKHEDKHEDKEGSVPCGSTSQHRGWEAPSDSREQRAVVDDSVRQSHAAEVGGGGRGEDVRSKGTLPAAISVDVVGPSPWDTQTVPSTANAEDPVSAAGVKGLGPRLTGQLKTILKALRKSKSSKKKKKKEKGKKKKHNKKEHKSKGSKHKGKEKKSTGRPNSASSREDDGKHDTSEDTDAL